MPIICIYFFYRSPENHVNAAARFFTCAFVFARAIFSKQQQTAHGHALASDFHIARSRIDRTNAKHARAHLSSRRRRCRVVGRFN